MKSPLVLMMALSLPSTASALGLGDIHVESALNEPLAADIDLVGATAEDLVGLTASIANKETFLHMNAERPSFLQSATFTVSQDSRGRPILSIRSTESFAEPLVDLVVDLRWHNGELIRQYSLLLDPADFAKATPLAGHARSSSKSFIEQPPLAARATSIPTAAAPITAAPITAAPIIAAPRKLSHVKIGAKATLRGVAWRVGARSEADLQTLMYAIFVANPSAFEGNINRLRRGAVLNIPPAADVAAFSKTDASRAIHAQMAAWREDPTASTSSALAHVSAASAAGSGSAATPSIAPAGAPTEATAPAALNRRMQMLEKNLSDMQLLFDREHDRMLGLQAQLAYAEKNQAMPVPSPAHSSPLETHRSFAALLAAGLGLIGAFGAYLYGRRRQRPPAAEPVVQPTTAPVPAPVVVAAKALDAQMDARMLVAATAMDKPRPHLDATDAHTDTDTDTNTDTDTDSVPSLASRILDDIDIASLESSYLEEATAVLENTDTTAKLEAHDQHAVDLEATLAADAEVNLEDTLIEDTVDLHHESPTMPAATLIVPLAPMTPEPAPATVHVDTTRLDYNLVDLDITAQHVQMPSLLHEPAVFKERRKNLVDVLKVAIEREPDRRDLRMKLLETYYAAAALNRQGFMDAVQKFARERDYLGKGEWDKIAFMGRQIAGDSALFAEAADKEDLADCA